MSFVEQPAPTDSRAVVALVLGILGLVLCPVLAPIAWAIGQTAEREIDATAGRVSGRGLATAGKITGIVGTVLLILYVVLAIALIAWAGSDLSTSSDPSPR